MLNLEENMKITIVSLIVAACIVSFAYAERPIEELPMYGGQHAPEVVVNIENSQSAAKLGWDYFRKGDLDTAMKRFNQAWMFDRDNVDALWGFGIIMGQRASSEDAEHNLQESIKYLDMANSKAGNNYRIMVDLAFSYTIFGDFLKSNGRSPEASKNFQQARKLFEQAKSIEPKYPLLYSNWSVLEFYEGNYQMAKTRLDKAKGLGFKPDLEYEKELGYKLKDVLPVVVEKINAKKYDQIKIAPNISISPDDQYIVFTYNDAIYASNINGANVKQITYPDKEMHHSPEFSIDGKKIFFWAKGIKDKKSRAMLVDFDGSNLKQLHIPENREVAGNVALGDGEKVYYIASNYDPGSPHSGEEIFVVNPEGVEQRVTHLNAFNIYYLDISLEGRQLFFLTHYMGMPDRFWVLPLDGKEQTELIIETKDDLEMHFRMSPDGKYVAFTGHLKSEVDRKFRYELFLMDNVSKKTIQLTRLNQSISFPRFYHHQDKIIFASDVNWLKGKPMYELWEINIDGTGLKKIVLSTNKAN